MKYLKHILLVLPALILTMMITCGVSVYADTNPFLSNTDDITVTLNNSYVIISGVTEGDLTLTKSNGDIAKAHVVLVKANAKAKFKAITPGYYTSGSTRSSRTAKAEAWSDSSWSVMSLTKMAQEYENAADTTAGSVIAAINGDFGISTNNGVVPRGSLVLEGNKEMAHSLAQDDEFFFGYKDNDVLNIVQRITSQKEDFSEALCGPMFILRNGSLFGVDTENDYRSRTGVAYKTNGDVLLIAVDEGDESSGISVKQLAKLMKASGCWNGLNLDGGGSTTMLTKRSGEALSRKTFEISNTYGDKDAETGERKISSGLLLVADDSVANNVNAINTVATDKESYYAGDTIKVTASTNSDGAWVSLQKYEEDGSFNVNSTSYFWYYVYGDNDACTWCWENGATYDICKDGECSKRDGVISSRGLPAGDYKVSLAQYVDPSDYDKGYKLLASKDITIAENPNPPDFYSIETNKAAYEVGEPIYVTATAPASDGTAWVGVAENGVPLDSGHSSYYWYYVEGYNNGSNHYNGETYNLYEQEQNSNGNVDSSLIDKKKRTLLSGTFDISVYDNDSHHIAEDNGKPVTTTIVVYDPNADYEIEYKNGDQTISGLTPVKYNYSAESSVILPSKAEVEAAVDGYNFYGWYTNSEMSGNAVTEIPKISAGKKTFYAKLEPKTYTVYFDTDGGTEIESQTIEFGQTAAKPSAEPEKDECIFLGWVTARNGTKEFDFDQPITKDTTVYASWGEKGYIVTFDTCGGSNVNKQTVKSGGTARQPSNPTRTGYRFAGWVTASGGSTRFDFSTIITGDITIYASWRALNYSITYDLNGGTAGEAQANPSTYNIETPTITLKEPSKEDHSFTGWKDEEGNIVVTIEQGSIGDMVLTAQWKKNPSLSTDKEEYVDGQAVNVTAYCENNESWVGLYSADPERTTYDSSYIYYYYVKQSESEPTVPYAENGTAFNLLKGKKKAGATYGPGDYVVVLFGDGSYSDPIKEVPITVTANTDPVQGTLTIDGYSRDDKTYSGQASSENERTLYEFFYGDSIEATAVVTGTGAENAWVGVITDEDYSKGNANNTVAGHWYWTEDYKGKSVNLNYMVNDEINEENTILPFGLNYWVVLVSGSGEILDGSPFNYRTFNMDWNNVIWGDSAKQKIKVDLEWTSRLADGTDQKPALTLTRINGHFGYEKDAAGQFLKDDQGGFVEITEHELEQGSDYTVSYPSESKDPGTYSIKVTFPSEQPGGENNYYKYLSTNSANYGFKDGITYYLNEEEGQHVIRYELNGGINNASNPSLYKKGEEVKLLPPSRNGYVFEGWYTTIDFQKGTLIEKISADSDEDITIYAKWANEYTAAYKITYVLNGGTNSAKNPDGYTGNVDVSLQPAQKANSTFDGWFFDAEFTKSADVITKGTTGDITVYAKFTKEESLTFAISTSVSGGSISDDVRVKKGASHTVTYEANSGNVLESVTVDGVEVDIKSYPASYTFENVLADHTISVVYSKEGDVSSIINGGTYTFGSQTYVATKVADSDEEGEVTFTKAKNKKKVTVPDTVKLSDGKTYKVTAIAAKAFNKKKIRTITIGKNVRRIEQNAFKSSKATKLIIKTKLLKKATVKGSLKKSKIKNISVKIGTKKQNKTYIKKYKKCFTKKNAGRKVTVK